MCRKTPSIWAFCFKKRPVKTAGLILSAWEEELQLDQDKEFILNGTCIQNGFHIIDPNLSPQHVEVINHPSSSKDANLFEKATNQILAEIAEGNYILAPSPPIIVSPIGIIPKSDGGIRIIHDCSRPKGLAVNDYVSNTFKFKYQSLDDAKKLVNPNCYMAKVDRKSAYRSVPISKQSQRVTGLKWFINNRVTYLYDTKLPFGSKEAPGIFHHLS